MANNNNALFVSYNAATEPLVRSQVLPYISELSGKGTKFYFMSYEKDASSGAEIADILKKSNIEWIRLKFHSKPLALAKAFDIKLGGIIVFWICLTKKIGVVHARGIMGAVISILSARMTGAKFIFDMKSSLAEAYRLNGRIKRESFTYKMIASLEKRVILNSDEVIVETATHKSGLERLTSHRKRRPHITVLPCCVDIERFSEKKSHSYVAPDGSMKLIYLGSLSGWYMLPEMLDFFKELKIGRPGSEFLFLSDDKDGSIPRLAGEKGLDGIIVTKSSYEDVPKSLWGATAGVLFKWPNERLDSFPIKIAEYLAAGLPIIINAGMGDVEDLVTRNRVGAVVRSCDKEAYRKAIDDLAKLLQEGEVLQKRCVAVASSQLSASFGLSQYTEVYARQLNLKGR